MNALRMATLLADAAEGVSGVLGTSMPVETHILGLGEVFDIFMVDGSEFSVLVTKRESE